MRSQPLSPDLTKMGTRLWTRRSRTEWNKSWRKKGCVWFLFHLGCFGMFLHWDINLIWSHFLLGRTQWRASQSWKQCWIGRGPQRDDRSSRGLSEVCVQNHRLSQPFTRFFFDEWIFYWLTVTTPLVFNLHDFGCTYISGCKCISDLMSSGYVCLSIPGWFTKLLSLKMPWSLYCPNWMLSWKKWDFKHSTQTTKTWIGRWLEMMWVFRSTKVMTFLNWQINN